MKKKLKLISQKVLIILSVLLSYFMTNSCHKPTPIETTQSYNECNKLWNNFRDSFPYHIQTIGVYEYDDNSYTFIISEPAPHTDSTGFEKVFEKYNHSLKINTNKIGVDGWVKDIIVSLNDIEDNEKEEIIKEISKYNFDTDYKAYALDLKSLGQPNYYLDSDVNYQISAAELNKWFFVDKEEFIDDDNTSFTIDNLPSSDKSNLYYSKKSGLVIWAFDLITDLANEKETIRKFALDSDIILGSIETNGKLIIVARERQNTVYELPPLRAETVLLLASAKKSELSQSYERINLFAGKLPNSKDWAPILLSDELKNTEYGSLLNITDQMLKSWSQNGEVDYENFNHPKPQRKAFKKPISTVFREELETNRTTFNWNTKAAVYSVGLADKSITAFNRTGSLPVTYIPEGYESVSSKSIEKYMEVGYDYFSNLHNPNLLRAAQYATLYQIFYKYSPQCTFEINENDIHDNNASLEAEAENLLTKIKNLSEEDKARIIQPFKTSLDKALKEKADKNDLLSNILQEYWGNSVLEEQQIKIDSLISLVGETFDTGNISVLSKAIANPRSIQSQEEYDRYKQISDLVRGLDTPLFDVLNINREDICNQFIKSNNNSFSNWIKTPTVVISWAKDSATSIGGHNIDSRIVHFLGENTVERGSYEIVKDVNGVKSIKINDADIDKISDSKFLRSVEESEILGVQKFENTTNKPIRERLSVIDATDNPVRGLNPKHIVVSKKMGGIGYVIDEQVYKDYKSFIGALGKKIHSQGVHEARIDIEYEGFSEDEVRGTIKTSEIKLNEKQFLLRNHEINKINGLNYDFNNIEIVNKNEIIEINIPRKAIVIAEGNLMPSGSIKLKIKNVAEHLLQRVRDILNKLVLRAKREPKMDFHAELQKELFSLGFSEEDIKIQGHDVLIANLYLRFLTEERLAMK